MTPDPTGFSCERQPQYLMWWAMLVGDIARWQQVQFPKSSAKAALEHIKKEVKELDETPSNPEEWADMFHLVIQGGVKASGNIEQFMEEVQRKFAKNKSGREWPGEPDADGVYLHKKGVAD